MAKLNITPEELERVEEKEIPKHIHYHYMCNQRSTGEELLLFFEKLVILAVFLILLFAFFPSIADFIGSIWENYTTNSGVAY